MAGTSTEDQYAARVTEIADKIARATDATEFVLNFFEKMVKLEAAHGKSIEELCTSRIAKLNRLFGSGTTEHVPEVDQAWATAVADYQAVAEQHKQTSKRLYKEVCAPLFNLHGKVLPKQASKAAVAKKVIRELKSEAGKAATAKARYLRASKELILKRRKLAKMKEDVMVDGEIPEKDRARFESLDGDLIKLSTQKDGLAEVYQKTLDGYADQFKTTFEVALPGLLKEIKDVETSRLQAFSAACTYASDIITDMAQAVTFAKTAEALKALTPEVIRLCEVDDVEIVTPEAFVEPTEEELVGEAPPATEAKSSAPTAAAAEKTTSEMKKAPEAKPSGGGGFFSSLFSSSSKPAAKKEEAKPSDDTPAAEEPAEEKEKKEADTVEVAAEAAPAAAPAPAAAEEEKAKPAAVKEEVAKSEPPIEESKAPPAKEEPAATAAAKAGEDEDEEETY